MTRFAAIAVLAVLPLLASAEVPAACLSAEQTAIDLVDPCMRLDGDQTLQCVCKPPTVAAMNAFTTACDGTSEGYLLTTSNYLKACK